LRQRILQPLLRQCRANSASHRSITAVSRCPVPSTSKVGTTSQRRHLHAAAVQKSVYDDFRNILDDAERPPIMVESISETTIKLTDGIILPANCVFLNGTAFMWDVPPPSFGWAGWQKEMFQVFEMVAPKPDILLFGTGRSALPPPPWLRPYLNSLGIQLDTMDSRNACATFNLLAEEGRRVAAACLTLVPLDARTGSPIEADKLPS